MVKILSKFDESYKITVPRSSTNSEHKKHELNYIPRNIIIKLHETNAKKHILKTPSGKKDTLPIQ